MKISWNSIQTTEARAYCCPYCNNQVASNKAFTASTGEKIYVCTLCYEPTYFGKIHQVPDVAFGDQVNDLPPHVEAIYNEARRCIAVSGYTSSVMLCRKVLMNVAVAEGAPTNKSFASYVDFLADQGYVPPKGRGWVDHIRTKGNEANHEINAMTKEDADELILFTGMLLKFMYELPARRPPQP